MTSAIVTSTYRYKRPPRKRKPVAFEVPAIVTIRRKGRADVADLTPEEHQRQGDAADALFQEPPLRNRSALRHAIAAMQRHVHRMLIADLHKSKGSSVRVPIT